MEFKVTKATQDHGRYFKKEVLENGAGYVVSDSLAIAGMFSFMIDGPKATLNFPYCIHKKAIEMAIHAFLEDYPEVTEIKCLSFQKLNDLGFKNQIYTRE